MTNDLPALLQCPACGDTYLHHCRVEIFERSEDAEQGLHVDVCGCDQFEGRLEPRIVIDKDMGRCPSARRHGVRIELYCENCHERSALTVAQHKGETEVSLERIGGTS